MPMMISYELPPQLLMHTMRTKELAVQLARYYGLDAETLHRVELGALLHDNCRHWPPERLLAAAQEFGYEPDEVERESPVLLHARIGALRLKDEYSIIDEVVYFCVFHHTVGGPDMGDAAKIIYCADKIEPGRDYPGADRLRRIAPEGLKPLCREIVSSTVDYLNSLGRAVHPATLAFQRELDGEKR
jgi:predicted HD superfamily hydrolase involved in NAD metabolism